MDKLILAIDQGTSGTKALLFDAAGHVVKKGMEDLVTNYSENGFVEQDPQAILNSVKNACIKCLDGIDASSIISIGISNQRETFVLWDKDGNAITPAIVWACKRSTEICKNMLEQNEWIGSRTGLTIDPYFSATKLLWLMQESPELKHRIQNKEVYFGTIDTWLLFNLTNGLSYYTDYTNASRTLLFNLTELKWDQEILEKWGLIGLHLPKPKPSSDEYGSTNLFGIISNRVPVQAMVGDSHAAMFGECCFETGETKMTLGTGCSMLMHIGNKPVASKNGLLTTIGWSTDQEVVYAWEGAIVACGSMITWLKDALQLFAESSETEAITRSVNDNGGIYLIPAFSGLGAPYWDMHRKASIHGLNFGSNSAHIVRATLESICFQIQDVLLAMEKDLNHPVNGISMHGGLSKNGFICETLAALINCKIQVQDNADISAQGAAFLAGLKSGIFASLDSLKQLVKKESVNRGRENKEINLQYNHWKEIIRTNKY